MGYISKDIFVHNVFKRVKCQLLNWWRAWYNKTGTQVYISRLGQIVTFSKVFWTFLFFFYFWFFLWPLFVGSGWESNFPNNQKALCAIFRKLFHKMSHFNSTPTFEYELAFKCFGLKCKFLGKSWDALKIDLSVLLFKSDWVDVLKYICINFWRFQIYLHKFLTFSNIFA